MDAAAPDSWEPITGVRDGEDAGLWYNPREPARVGLPAPVASLLAALPDLIETLQEP